MASASTAMVRPPSARATPPQPPSSRLRPPPPPKAPPPPPPKRSPPRPPPPRNEPAVVATKSVPVPPAPSASGGTKRLSPSENSNTAKRLRVDSTLSIRVPKVLRDVNVYEKSHMVGEGTYGSVFVGIDKVTRGVVALKRINTQQEENGFPITAIREVKILKALNHDNIISLQEIVTSKEQSEQGSVPKMVFMVFEYMEYDLTGLLETAEIRFSQDHVKSWSQQLLKGTHYMHINKIIHRDLKASNLLLNRKGELKIADWGLARSWSSDMKRLTNKVITLWYRPPELLLGALEYSPKIDMWSVGCIIAEMFRRSGFLKGKDEATQLDIIFRTCGHPTVEDWPDIDEKCKLWKKFAPAVDQPRFPNRLAEALKHNLPQPKWMTDNAIHMISKLMELNPEKRWSAEQALDADYFFENPIVKSADQLSMNFSVKSVHEWECRQRYEAKVAALKAQQNAPKSNPHNAPKSIPHNAPKSNPHNAPKSNPR